jgi:hypothetical protein
MKEDRRVDSAGWKAAGSLLQLAVVLAAGVWAVVMPGKARAAGWTVRVGLQAVAVMA